jgi:hypothetical protein
MHVLASFTACSGQTFTDAPAETELEKEPAVIPKGKGCVRVPGPGTITWHRLMLDAERLLAASTAEPPSPDEVYDLIERVEHQALTPAQRKLVASMLGWTHLGFLGKLNRMYGFDLVKDVIPDLMHLSMVIIKDLVRITANVINGWKEQPAGNPCGVNTWEDGVWVNRIAAGFRRNVHPGFGTGRRFFRDLTPEMVASWTAEECLVFLRLQWRFLLQQLVDVQIRAGQDVPEVMSVLIEAWEKLEAALLPHMDRRGCQLSEESLRQSACAYQLHLVHATIAGHRAFSLSYMTHTVHMLTHLHKYHRWWGDLWTHWCFVYERMASEVTQLLTGWHGGEPASYVAKRLSLKRASVQLLRQKQR